jgi:hypothetical protein
MLGRKPEDLPNPHHGIGLKSGTFHCVCWRTVARKLGESLKHRIMPVDDEPPVLHVLKALLEAHGYQVIAMASLSRANNSTSQGTRTASPGISLA